MKRRTLVHFQTLTLVFALMFILSACSSEKVDWKDTTINVGLDSYVPHFLSEIKFISESENGKLTVVDSCFITENLSDSPMCYSTGENSRFELRHYMINQAQGIAYSLIYYFDGTKKRLIDWGGDNVFSRFALCDGEHLCYLVSDGTLRVLEKDGGREDYENFFDSEKINLGFGLGNVFLFAEGNKILLGQERLPSNGDMIINGERETVTEIVGETEVSKSPNAPKNSEKEAYWSDKTVVFDEGKTDFIPRYIDENKKISQENKFLSIEGEVFHSTVKTVVKGGYIVLDSVKCYSTGENESFVVKAYRYECDDKPLCFEICRYENHKLKLLAFSGDNRFSDCFMCDGNRLCYIVDGEILRVMDKDGSQTDYEGFKNTVYSSSVQLCSEDGKTVIVKDGDEQIAVITP